MTLGELFQQYPAAFQTIGLAFVFLWLGLYVFRVDPEDTASRLAAGAMVAVFLFLLGDLLASVAVTKTQLMLFRRSFWWLPFAPVFWLHLSQEVTRPLEFRGVVRKRTGQALNLLRRPPVRGALYGSALLFTLAGMLTDSIFRVNSVKSASLPLKQAFLPTGPAYGLFALFVFVTAGVAWINFLAEWWRVSKPSVGGKTFFPDGMLELVRTGVLFTKNKNRSDFWWLSFGGILFWISSAGLLIKTTTGYQPAHSWGNLILWAGMAIVAVAVLKHNALVKKEALRRDVIYATIGSVVITALYLAAVFVGWGGFGSVPVSVLVLVAALALSTHMLADALKIYFSEFVGKRLGLFTDSDVDAMRQLYQEASAVQRHREPAIELFEDGDGSVDHLLSLLTPRQREIITLRAKGLSDKQIAETLGIKLPTVRKHVEDIKNRLGSRDKADCAIYCVVTGLLDKEDLTDWFESLNIER